MPVFRKLSKKVQTQPFHSMYRQSVTSPPETMTYAVEYRSLAEFAIDNGILL